MSNITLVGIDLGKSSFHVVGRDPSEHTFLRKQFSRAQLCGLSRNNHPV